MEGLITMREAVRNSVNVYAVKLMNSMGVDYGWQFAKNNLGLNLTEKDKVLSMSLGTFQISTLQMASALCDIRQQRRKK
jgi:penicillin-binding protein 1A